MSVNDKIKAGEYESKLPREFVRIPVDEDVMTVRQAREHTIAQDQEKGNYRRAIRDDNQRLENQFHKDLADEFGLTGHPKELKLWDIACSLGHDAGMLDIVSWYQDLADLVK
jgi:hypothetical protein